MAGVNNTDGEKLTMSKAKTWLLEIRAPFLTGSITPVLLGTAIAWAMRGVFLPDVFILTLIAGVCLHIAANVSNDYFDHTENRTGSDDINVDYVRPFTGGSRMIQLGLLSPRAVLVGSFVFFGIAGVIGLYLSITRSWLILLLGLIGAGSGFFYTAPPFRLVKRGIGEVFIGLNFGVLLTFGAYYVQALDIVLEPIVASIPVALLIAGILYINEFPDFTADRDAGKRTIVVRLGRARAAKGYAIIIIATFLSIIIPVFLQLIPVECLLTLTLLPIGYVGVHTALREFDNTMRLIPANAATITLHLLTTVFLTVAYVLSGLNLGILVTAITCGIMVLIVVYYYRKLTSPPCE